MFYTVYKTTNRVNGKFYIGTHKTIDPNDAYLGSGVLITKAIEKYGVNNFTKEILFIFDNPEDMFAKEAEIVTEDFLAENNTYNLKRGGFGGFDSINKDVNKSLWSSMGAKAKYAKHGTKGLIPGLQSNDHFYKLLIGAKTSPRFLGKKHSQESKNKISKKAKINQSGIKNSQYGTIWITNGKENKKIKFDSEIPVGYVKGRKLTNRCKPSL